MKKKAECEARDSLQPAEQASNSNSVSSVPDDARELIDAMQNASSQAVGSEKSQKSRARRLTSTVALDDKSKPETASLGDGSGNNMIFCGCAKYSVHFWCFCRYFEH